MSALALATALSVLSMCEDNMSDNAKVTNIEIRFSVASHGERWFALRDKNPSFLFEGKSAEEVSATACQALDFHGRKNTDGQ